MIKKSNIVIIPILIIAVIMICFSCFGSALKVSALDMQEDTTVIENVESQEIDFQSEAEPRLLTRLSLTLGALNGEVYARVKNEFTLGFAVVQVYAQLYSSYTYQSSYTSMTLESQAYIADLNIYETLRTASPINGEQKYWMARAYYKIDNGDWKERVTGVYLIDANGNNISY